MKNLFIYRNVIDVFFPTKFEIGTKFKLKLINFNPYLKLMIINYGKLYTILTMEIKKFVFFLLDPKTELANLNIMLMKVESPFAFNQFVM